MIRKIVALNHEIGYHYEDMSICNGDVDRAVEHFKKWLEYFRRFYPVKTVCMHGAPTSSYDSRDIWKFMDYRSLDIIGEPYYDTDFTDLFYITDTGRRWDGFKVSVRDKIPKYQDEWCAKGLMFRFSNDVIRAVENNTFPHKLMMTTHPQRWFDFGFKWMQEFVLQNIKNCIKAVVVLIAK